MWPSDKIHAFKCGLHTYECMILNKLFNLSVTQFPHVRYIFE